MCVNSLSIKALCIEGNYDSQYNFIDKMMDRLLRPEKLETDSSSRTASKDWLRWHCNFENFLTVLPKEGFDHFLVLTNYVSPRIFEYIEHCGRGVPTNIKKQQLLLTTFIFYTLCRYV